MAILRAHRDEPLIRHAAKDEDGDVRVRSERSYQEISNGLDNGNWLGWPKSDVYEYNERDFVDLKKLWEGGLGDDLRKRWSQCQPFSA